jgi:hypothetical protein
MAICAVYAFDKVIGIFMRDKPIFFSERMLCKDYDHKGSVEKEIVVSLMGFGAKRN